MLMRVFLGWLRGERGHCGMVAIPTMEEEDARRPSRERESLVNERSRIVNRMKSALARLGIRGFKPHLRRAPERLAYLRTAEGTGLPANIIEELRRDMARPALVREQISSIEKTRAERLERAPDTGPHAMVRLLSRCRWENGPAASEPCPQKRMTASWSGPYMGSTEYKRGSRA